MHSSLKRTFCSSSSSSSNDVQCPICFRNFAQKVIAQHAAECGHTTDLVASSESASSRWQQDGTPEAKRRRCDEQPVTIFTIVLELTQQLSQSSSDEVKDDVAHAPAGKARCPVCWRLFNVKEVDAHALECDGKKRLKSADAYLKAYVPPQAIINFDSAVDFLARLRTGIQKLGLDGAKPLVVYHWTAEKNHSKIEDTNFYVPKPSQVANANAYGNGIYAAVGFNTTRDSYGKGSEQGILCLAVPGRVYDNDASGHKCSQQNGYDSACFWDKRGYVFFSVDQLLPCFLVSKQNHSRAEKRIEHVLAKLVKDLNRIAGAEHDSAIRVASRKSQGLVQSWLDWLRTLLGI